MVASSSDMPVGWLPVLAAGEVGGAAEEGVFGIAAATSGNGRGNPSCASSFEASRCFLPSFGERTLHFCCTGLLSAAAGLASTTLAALLSAAAGLASTTLPSDCLALRRCAGCLCEAVNGPCDSRHCNGSMPASRPVSRAKSLLPMPCGVKTWMAVHTSVTLFTSEALSSMNMASSPFRARLRRHRSTKSCFEAQPESSGLPKNCASSGSGADAGKQMSYSV